MQDKNYLIPHNLAQDIINYLGSRPLIEVEQLVNGMRLMKEHKQEHENAKTDIREVKNGKPDN